MEIVNQELFLPGVGSNVLREMPRREGENDKTTDCEYELYTCS